MNASSSNHDSTKTLDSQSGLEKKSRFKVKNLTPEETFHEQQIAEAPVGEPDSRGGIEENSKEGGATATADTADPNKGNVQIIPKKSRFTVKTVPKDEERSGDVVHDTAKTAMPQFLLGGTDNQQIFDACLAQSNTILRLERLLELNTQMLSKLAGLGTAAGAATTVPDMLMVSRSVDSGDGAASAPPMATRDRAVSRATEADAALATPGVGQKGTSGFVTVSAISGVNVAPAVTAPHVPTSTPTAYLSSIPANTASSYADKGEKPEKEKSFAKMAHYLSELKRELDAAQKQRKDASLEMQGLRDKCQQLEDRLSVEQARAQGLEERLERAKGHQRLLQAQVDAQSLKLAEQEALINSFGAQTSDAGIASTSEGTISLPSTESNS